MDKLSPSQAAGRDVKWWITLAVGSAALHHCSTMYDRDTDVDVLEAQISPSAWGPSAFTATPAVLPSLLLPSPLSGRSSVLRSYHFAIPGMFYKWNRIVCNFAGLAFPLLIVFWRFIQVLACINSYFFGCWVVFYGRNILPQQFIWPFTHWRTSHLFSAFDYYK